MIEIYSILPEIFVDTLTISIVLSTMSMIFIQKLKAMKIVKKSSHIFLANIFFCLVLGISFSMYFYGTNLVNSIWVGIPSLIGASTIYEALKNQKIVNFRPNSLNN